MFKKATYFLAATALLGLALSGCSNSKTDGSVVTPNPNSFQPKGTVAGVLTDSATNEPIANATIYIMDKSATTNAGGSFSIANVPANVASGNEPTNAISFPFPRANNICVTAGVNTIINTVPIGDDLLAVVAGANVITAGGDLICQTITTAGDDVLTITTSTADAYQVVINMKAVNDAIAAYNANAANTTKKAYYPSFAYTTATVKYDSLGDAGLLGAAGTSATNHDTPVDGFVASIAPKVGKLDANVKIQVVNSSTFANISGATVELISQGSGSLANTPTGSAIVAGSTGHIVASGTTDANGLVTFSGVEAKSIFAARATSSDGMLSGTTGDAGLNDGTANKGPATITTEADNVTVSYLLNQLPNNALMISPVDDQAPVILSSTPELNSDLTVPTTGGQNVVFTFSKAIQADAYALATTASSVNAAAPIGTGTLYKDISVTFDGSKAGNIAYTLAWSTDMKTLTVNLPSLSPSSKYTVDLTATTLVDSLNQPVANRLTAGKVMFTTNGGATAAAPVIVAVESVTLDASKIDFNSSVKLDWKPASGAKKYNVYRSLVENWTNPTATTATPYRLINTVAGAPVTVSNSEYVDDFADDAIGDKNILKDTTNGPLSATTNFVEAGHVKLTYKYKVLSVNSDGTEGAASNEVTVADVTGSNIPIAGAGATFITDIIDGNNTVTVFFTEPLDETSAETETNYTLSGISGTAPTVSSAVYNGWISGAGLCGAVAPAVGSCSSVTLTLFANLNPSNITRSYISTGADGILSTTVMALDGALFPLDSGGLCVSPVGTGDTGGTALATALLVDDVAFKSADAPTAQANSIYAGANGTCDSTAAASDTQIVAVASKPGANALGISAATYTNAVINNTANDFTLQTVTLNGTPPAVGTADDLIVRQILVTVGTGMTDVAGNAIKTTTVNATTAGNRINSDGTFTLP